MAIEDNESELNGHLGRTARELILSLPAAVKGLQTVYFCATSPIPTRAEERLRRLGLPDLGCLAWSPPERWNDLFREIVEHGNAIVPVATEVHELAQQLDALLSMLPPDQILTICSLCRLRDRPGLWHLPLVDFRSGINDTYQRFLARMMAADGQSGFLLNSGNSYHFLGTLPLAPDQWTRWMGHLLLLPYVDVRYVGHRLIDGMGALRINSSKTRPEPRVVAIVPDPSTKSPAPKS